MSGGAAGEALSGRGRPNGSPARAGPAKLGFIRSATVKPPDPYTRSPGKLSEVRTVNLRDSVVGLREKILDRGRR